MGTYAGPLELGLGQCIDRFHTDGGSGRNPEIVGLICLTPRSRLDVEGSLASQSGRLGKWNMILFTLWWWISSAPSRRGQELSIRRSCL